MASQPNNVVSMADYMQNYGARLNSLLQGGPLGTDPRAIGAPGGPQSQLAPDGAGGSAVPPQTPVGPDSNGQPGSLLGQRQTTQSPQTPSKAVQEKGGPGSFEAHWKAQDPAQQAKATDDLEAQLKQGNQTIDSAYDDLVKQMGTRPDGKITREDKGMLLMEFGLSLMKNSASSAYGRNLGGAVGAAGLDVFQGQRARTEGRQAQYDQTRLGIESKRADAKADLSKQSALEGRAEARDNRRADRENSQLAGTVTGADDQLYGYTRGGSVSKLEQPGGGSVKVKPKPAGGGGGPGGAPRTTDQKFRYDEYMRIHGVDSNGTALEGAELRTVQDEALKYASNPKNSELTDPQIRTQAEKSADSYMRANWQLYAQLPPDEVEKKRAQIADDHFKRIKAGMVPDTSKQEAAQLREASKGGHGRISRGTSQLAPAAKGSQLAPKTYASQDEVNAAFDAGEVSNGDVVVINGKRFRVQQ